MKLQYHTAFSAVIAGILYMTFKSWGLAAACFISGIVIDLDHIIDVVREHGWSVKTKEFFRICHTAQFDRIFLLWHGWEWLVICAIAAWATEWNPWITGTLIGITFHMILDSYQNSLNLRTYSLIWRWKNDFVFDVVFPKLLPVKYKNHNRSSKLEK